MSSAGEQVFAAFDSLLVKDANERRRLSLNFNVKPAELIKQIKSSSENPTAVLAMFGVEGQSTKMEAVDLNKDGEISQEEILAFLSDNAGIFGDAKTIVDNFRGKLSAGLSGAEDSINDKASDIGDAAQNKLVEWKGVLDDTAGDLASLIKRTGSKYGLDFVETLVDDITGVISAVSTVISTVINTVSKCSSILGGIGAIATGNIVGGISTVVNGVSGCIQGIQETAKKVKGAINAVKITIKNLAASVKKGVADIKAWVQRVKETPFTELVAEVFNSDTFQKVVSKTELWEKLRNATGSVTLRISQGQDLSSADAIISAAKDRLDTGKLNGIVAGAIKRMRSSDHLQSISTNVSLPFFDGFGGFGVANGNTRRRLSEQELDPSATLDQEERLFLQNIVSAARIQDAIGSQAAAASDMIQQGRSKSLLVQNLTSLVRRTNRAEQGSLDLRKVSKMTIAALKLRKSDVQSAIMQRIYQYRAQLGYLMQKPPDEIVSRNYDLSAAGLRSYLNDLQDAELEFQEQQSFSGSQKDWMRFILKRADFPSEFIKLGTWQDVEMDGKKVRSNVFFNFFVQPPERPAYERVLLEKVRIFIEPLSKARPLKSLSHCAYTKAPSRCLWIGTGA